MDKSIEFKVEIAKSVVQWLKEGAKIRLISLLKKPIG